MLYVALYFFLRISGKFFALTQSETKGFNYLQDAPLFFYTKTGGAPQAILKCAQTVLSFQAWNRVKINNGVSEGRLRPLETVIYLEAVKCHYALAWSAEQAKRRPALLPHGECGFQGQSPGQAKREEKNNFSTCRGRSI